MPNSPGPETVTVSFTLPRELAAAVAKHAKKNLTNKSDIIRRALLEYIPKDEAEAILKSMLNEEAAADPPSAVAAVTYPKGKASPKKKPD